MTRRVRIWITGISGLFALIALGQGGQAGESLDTSGLPPAATDKVDFVKHIQPLLRARCYSCHGEEDSEGGLRLDLKAAAFEGGDSGVAFEAGNSADSRLIHFVARLDEDEAMPPEGEGSPLSTEQVAMLRAWIDQGAEWPDGADGDAKLRGADHWAFQPIVAPEVPQLNNDWVRNPVDAFVLRKLQAEKAAPSAEAPRRVQIRRLYLDLVGLPPSPEEWARWMNDDRDDWYEQLVDHLLASPHFGERWSRPWLDVARYADSDGFEKDLPRPHAWRWRNWVIDAINADMPFDQFTIQQLAGDLLADRTTEQHVATGFHRNTLVNREGGVDAEEDRVKRTVDRTNTLGSAWLGMTVECAQCHTHKYDPITQREFYGLYAFFNSLEEPNIAAPYPDEVAKYNVAKAAFDKSHQKYLDAIDEYRATKLVAAQDAWEKEQAKRPAEWNVIEPTLAKAESNATITAQSDGSMLVSGNLPSRDIYHVEAKIEQPRITAVRLEVLPHESLPKNGPGRGNNGNILLNEFKLSVRPANSTDKAVEGDKSGSIKIASARADFFQAPYGPDGALVENRDGWSLLPQVGQRHVAVFELAEPLEEADSYVLAIEMKQQYGGARTIGRFRLSLTDRDEEVEFDAISSRITDIIHTPVDERTAEQASELLEYHALLDEGLVALHREEVAHDATAPPDPATLTLAQVVRQQKMPRKTHVQIRGDFLRPGAEVQAGTPEILPEIKVRGEQPDRLDLANWLLAPEHPLTARVAVNRIWQQYFGQGIVPTGHDFGTQGDPPSHPELLDYLANRFRETGWQVKALHRLIVTSATYRQSSHARADLAERDPYNTWLGRQNRLRVEAEIVRDLALTVSGLLHTEIGGRSVRPPQPKGIDALGYANSVKWETSEGKDRYRRGLYTFFQRTVPYPMLMTFDAPDSNVSCTARDRSNTPIQALALWNDPVFVECAQALARRLTQEVAKSSADESETPGLVRHAFAICLSREPREDELADFVTLHDIVLGHYEKDSEAAAAVAGSLDKPENVSDAELAAAVTVARTLMNLDEFITKE